MMVTVTLATVELFAEMSMEAAVPQWHSLACCVQPVLFQNAFFLGMRVGCHQQHGEQ